MALEFDTHLSTELDPLPSERRADTASEDGAQPQSTFSTYLKYLQTQAKLHDRRTLYTTYNYQYLLDFISATGKKSRVGSREPNLDATDELVWIYYFKLNIPRSPTNVPTPDVLRTLDDAWRTYDSCGHLIILRGYPSAQWIDSLGCAYHPSAEFWRRHLSFLGSSRDDRFTCPHLPSSSCEILKLRITTIGLRSKRGTENEFSTVNKLRSEGERAMTVYNEDLRWGTGWRAGDSIVRGYAVYDSETFSIDQTITMCINVRDVSRKYWQALIYTDCGRDLASSPYGPWLGDTTKRTVDTSTNLLPLHWHTANTSLDAQVETHTEQNDLKHGFVQNLEQFHVDFGLTLKHDLMCIDPFYATSDVLKLVAVAESKLLNMIEFKLEKDTKDVVVVDTDSKSGLSADSVAAQSNLVHKRQILQDRMQNLQEILSFLQRQQSLDSWHSVDNNEQYSTTRQQHIFTMELDFQHLLEKADILHKRCESAMVIAMNSASLAEARRGFVQARSLFKFTVLASIYVPLSFTSTFMGMNIAEFNQGSIYGVWIFFAITLPIFGASVLYLFVDWLQLYTVLRTKLVWF